MSQTVTISLPYRFQPRTYQARTSVAYRRGCRKFLKVQHRRSGKTEEAVAFVSARMAERTGTYLHIFPLLRQARESVWRGINRAGMRYLGHFPPPLLYGLPNNAEMAVTYKDLADPTQPGSRYVMMGTDRNMDAVVGMNPIGIIWDEFAMQNPLARQLARPILLENGGWELVITTPRGENHAHSLYQHASVAPDWHCEYLDISKTRRDSPSEDGQPVFTEAQVEQERIEMIAQGEMSADAIVEQEYYLSWQSPMPGAYYGEAIRRLRADGRVTGVPFDPSRPVSTAWDLGTSKAHDTQSIWFYQMQGSRVCIIDYLQSSNHGIDWYSRELNAKPYQYQAHYAQEFDLKEADWGTGKTRVETAKAFGINFTPVPRLSMIEYINATRMVLARCHFDDGPSKPHPEGGFTGVGAGLNALSAFRREYDSARRVFLDHPVHDWASHGATGFHYLALSIEDPFQHEQVVPVGRARQAHGVNVNPMARW